MTIVIYKYSGIGYFAFIMKAVLYLSGILGVIMFIVGVLGSLVEFPGSELIMFTGIALFIILFLPLLFFQKYKQERTNKEIIESSIYKVDKSKPEEQKKSKTKTKGWGMNNSPFRKRKSGLTWGGGNIYGAKASRGERRSFLK